MITKLVVIAACAAGAFYAIGSKSPLASHNVVPDPQTPGSFTAAQLSPWQKIQLGFQTSRQWLHRSISPGESVAGGEVDAVSGA